jgi:hypothetical protein
VKERGEQKRGKRKAKRTKTTSKMKSEGEGKAFYRAHGDRGLPVPATWKPKRTIVGETVPSTGNPIDSVTRFRLDFEATAIITLPDAAVEAPGALNADGVAANV